MDDEKMTKKEWMEFTKKNTQEMAASLGAVIKEVLTAQYQQEAEAPLTQEAIDKSRLEARKAMRRMFACASLQMFRLDPRDVNNETYMSDIAIESWKMADKMVAASDLPPLPTS